MSEPLSPQQKPEAQKETDLFADAVLFIDNGILLKGTLIFVDNNVTPPLEIALQAGDSIPTLSTSFNKVNKP